ncbi:hypothetical protein [Lampropedia aestuarii]|uniref:hypothetical protein n=1 Tax=Lampropedia aestuarii TaxID=2562762 RepID=UPI00197EC08A|nr:hypothetical protein [Lampropedia aestuarii]
MQYRPRFAQWLHIVGLEVRVRRWEVKRKLSQNQSDQDRHGVIRALSTLGQHELANTMAEAMNQKTPERRP